MAAQRLARRLHGIAPTIFSEMSALAVRTQSVNLGQGFPDVDGPPAVIAEAARALQSGRTSTRRVSAYRPCGRRWPATSTGTTGSSWTPTPRSW